MRPLDPGRSSTLAEVFDSLKYPVRTDHEYFVAAPPEALELDPTQLRGLEVRKPFFVDHGWSFGPDQDLVPFVWDPRVGGQPRFSEAEALTDYDSGLLGLAAMSAPTAQSQAQLYAVLAQAIMDVHRSNRDLLGEWFDGQGPSSGNAFIYFDQQRPPAVEKLLAADGTIDRALWDARLDELAACLGRDAFQKHHFRWVEFLAHAVDIPQLVGVIREGR
jgi:hypothetical protein